MKELPLNDIAKVSGAGLLGAINLAISSGWAGAILGGRYGGSNGGIVGIGAVGNLVGLIVGGIYGTVGGFVKGLLESDEVAGKQATDIMESIMAGNMTKK